MRRTLKTIEINEFSITFFNKKKTEKDKRKFP